MTRYAIHGGAFEVDSMPCQSQVALCHSFYVRADMRGRGLGHALKERQLKVLSTLGFDYAICTVDSANDAQKTVLLKAGGRCLDSFKSTKTGGITEIWGTAVRGEVQHA